MVKIFQCLNFSRLSRQITAMVFMVFLAASFHSANGFAGTTMGKGSPQNAKKASTEPKAPSEGSAVMVMCPGHDSFPTGCLTGKRCRARIGMDRLKDARRNCEYTKTNNLCPDFQFEVCCVTTCNQFFPNDKVANSDCLNKCSSDGY